MNLKWKLDLILPVRIEYPTFQALSLIFVLNHITLDNLIFIYCRFELDLALKLNFKCPYIDLLAFPIQDGTFKVVSDQIWNRYLYFFFSLFWSLCKDNFRTSCFITKGEIFRIKYFSSHKYNVSLPHGLMVPLWIYKGFNGTVVNL